MPDIPTPDWINLQIEINRCNDSHGHQSEERRALSRRIVELTTGVEMHPDWWTNECGCETCMSYGDK